MQQMVQRKNKRGPTWMPSQGTATQTDFSARAGFRLQNKGDEVTRRDDCRWDDAKQIWRGRDAYLWERQWRG